MNLKQLLIFLTFIVNSPLFAQCISGPYTVSGNVTINSTCKITGDLTLLNGSTLNVDFTSTTRDTFVVQGNILLQGNAVLWVHSTPGSTNDQFIVSNNYSFHREITTQNTSKIQLEHIEFRTQEGDLSGASSVSMQYYAEDSSIFYINKSWLSGETAWLLLNMKDKSTLIGYEPNRVPTEMYLEDSAQVALHGSNTKTGIWLNCQNINDTLNLPPDQTAPFTWQVGRGSSGMSSPWYLEMDTVLSGVGVQVFPSTKLVVNGIGFPNTGELKVAMMFANNTDTIVGLQVGLQNTTITNGPFGFVTLNNVNLGPIAWQLYALMNEDLYVKNSVVNEIGIGGPSTITVENSLLQLAVLAAVGIGGSTMTINNTEIWNQEITAKNNSKIILNDCNVHGSLFNTADVGSSITVNRACFFQNPSGCTQATMVNVATGRPNCNPFIPPGYPQNLSPSTVTFNGVNYNCTTGINEKGSVNSFQIFPNPARETLNILLPQIQKTELQIFNTMGLLVKEILLASSQQINISDLQGGLYFIHLKNRASQTMKFIKQ